LLLVAAAAVVCLERGAFAKHKEGDGLKNATVLIIRHAEKPEIGAGLAPAGEQRAQAYVNYFQHFQAGGQPVPLDTLISTADSEGSMRPRLTLEPLAKALGLPLDTRFKDKQVTDVVADLQSRHPHVKGALICWHHGQIPELLQAFGADALHILPKGQWPADVFDWVVVLKFDHNGQLESAKYEVENLKIGS
jgi:hypothetical protein